MGNRNLLHIYLNDHLAGCVAVEEVAKRCLSSNAGTPLGDSLARLLTEIRADRKVLEDVMRGVGARKDPVKRGAAWAAEKLARLKLNGRVIQYSDLSRLEELEVLGLMVEAKASLWRSLATLAVRDPRLRSFDFGALERRAEGQRQSLERHRLEATARAFQP